MNFSWPRRVLPSCTTWLFIRFLLSKYSRPIFWTLMAFLIITPVQDINNVLYCPWISYFWWKMIFIIPIKSWILKQRELVNEFVKAWKGLPWDNQLGSLTDFYCQNIQSQFSGLIPFFIFKTVQNLNKGVYSSISKLFWWKMSFVTDMRRWILKQREFVNELVMA